MITVNDKNMSWQEGMTVRDLLNSLEDDHDYAVIRVNDKYVSKPYFDVCISSGVAASRSDN